MSEGSWFIVNRLPEVLSVDECLLLLERSKNGDKQAREKLIVHNIRLVLYEVKNRFRDVNYDKSDLVSYGIVGLMKAIDSFDISRNCQFVTYAVKCIDNEILMFLRKIKDKLNVISFNDVILMDSSGNDRCFEDIICNDDDMVENYETKELYDVIRNLINEFDDREKEILILYFGFYNNKRLTQRELAIKYNISQSYLSRILSRLLKQIELRLKEIYSEDSIENKLQQILIKKRSCI